MSPSRLPRGSYPSTAVRVTTSPTPRVPFALCSSKSWGLKSVGPIVFRERPNLPTLLGQKFCKLPSKSFPCRGLITARTLVPSFSSASSPTSGWLKVLSSSRNNRSVAARNWRCCKSSVLHLFVDTKTMREVQRLYQNGGKEGRCPWVPGSLLLTQ